MGSRTVAAPAAHAATDHGIIEVEDGAQGPRLLGRQSEGYYDMLGDWMLTRSFRRQYGSAIQASHRSLQPSRPAR
jgi:hypothetical protein